jgi:hypothetical protein
VDEDSGFACDIVHINGTVLQLLNRVHKLTVLPALGTRTYNSLLLSALLAHEDTQLVFRGEPALWNRALQDNGTYASSQCNHRVVHWYSPLRVAVVREMCSEHAGLRYGDFVRPYATSHDTEEIPVYDAQDLITDYLSALEQGTWSQHLMIRVFVPLTRWIVQPF